MTGSKWFPTTQQLQDPVALERSFRQSLTQQYALEARIKSLEAKGAIPVGQTQAGKFPPGSGPADSVLLGLPVQPIDAATLADGATLTWDKKAGVFRFA